MTSSDYDRAAHRHPTRFRIEDPQDDETLDDIIERTSRYAASPQGQALRQANLDRMTPADRRLFQQGGGVERAAGSGGPPTALPPDRARPHRPDSASEPPPAHSVTAHVLFGGCANCPDRTLEWELVRWRDWATIRGVAAWPQVEHHRGTR